MKYLYCEQGHFFDVDTYQTCPICGSGIKANQRGNSSGSAGKRNGFKDLFHLKKKKEPDSDQKMTEEIAEGAHAAQQPKASAYTDGLRADQQQKPEKMFGTVAAKMQNIDDAENPEREMEGDSDLKEKIRNAAGDRDGKTYGYFQKMVDDTQEMEEPERGNPVVGWLVAVKGPHTGASFDLHAGKNIVGRKEDNDVVLGRDHKVSRSFHAAVIFEPKKREFYIQPGSGSALTYYNGDFIAEMKKMEHGSRMEVGDTELRLYVLCGPDFSWETNEKTEEV